jgi:shikimate dehydrogenase
MTRQKLAVMGNPVSHSRSPEIHQNFALQSGIELRYEKILVPEDRFQEVATGFLETGGKGFNITLPCKGDAFAFVDSKSDSAVRSQAVNTIAADPGGQIYGDNTDGMGLVRDLTRNLGWQIRDQRLLVLGAGGAVRGILWDLLQMSPGCLHLHNRTQSKARALAGLMADARIRVVERGDLEEGYDLVINGTSAGLSGSIPDLPEKVLDVHSRCYDLAYLSAATAFTSWCRTASGCEVADGLGMLVEQAALSFHLWFSKKVKTQALISTLRRTG